MLDLLSVYLEQFTYAGIFVVLLLCGLGLPLPEETVIVAGGFLAYKGYTNLYMTIVVLVIGALTGDGIIYLLGRKWGDRVLGIKFLHTFLTKDKIQKTREYFDKYGDKAVFLARFFAGIRPVTFFMAGTMGMKPKMFLLMDGLASVISIPLNTTLVYYLGADIEHLVLTLRRVNRTLILVLCLICLLWLLYQQKKRYSPGQPSCPKE
ncbi:MAG TPA: DedA family protein [Candidatus Limnocylindrales bacterium]|nr:DedA family protein [Candidatus Limnocylindrales bacterium]